MRHQKVLAEIESIKMKKLEEKLQKKIADEERELELERQKEKKLRDI
jgi:hypothetical protein